jgi:type III pantothenate kinase
MLLAVDIGNTNSKFGLFEGDHLAAQWRVSTRREHLADEWRVLLRGLLAAEGLSCEVIHGAVIASVVPVVTEQIVLLCREAFRVEPLVVRPGIDCGLTLDDKPLAELGSDRIVQCVGALSLGPGPKIVVAMGTATVIDAMDGAGRYLGGAIAPGLKTAADALFSRAALLREVTMTAPEHALGKRTSTQLQSGLVFGWAGLIDGIIARMRGETGLDPEVISTGGLSELITPHSREITRCEPRLALLGLKALHNRLANRPS